MALAHSPKVVTDGLVFAYDMGNPQKSWKGAPTTNLANVGLNGMSGITLSFLGIEDGWKKYSMNGTFTGGTYPYIMNISSVAFTGGVTYSSVCYVKTNVENKFNYFGTGMNYVNVPMNKGGTSIGIRQSDNSFYCGRIDFEYTSNTTQPGYILSNPINNTSFSSSTDFVWIKEGQIEQQPFPTPFAGDAGTRSNTQAILDWTGNNTITASSLTYNSDNTFSFNGSSDFVQISQPAISTSPNRWTISFWINPGNQSSFFLTPNSSGIDHFLRYDSGNQRVNVQVTEAGDINNRNRTGTVGSVPINQWSFVSVTLDSLSIKIYVNGTLTNEYTETIPIANWVGTWRLGQRGNNTNWFLGRIENFSVYNRALTAAEVAQNFAALRRRYGI